MDERRFRRRTRILWVFALAGAIYLVVLRYVHPLTGTRVADGSIGVLLGLYICSHPAANAIDLLFVQHSALRWVFSGRSGVGWAVLNVLVMALGWLVIAAGATQLSVPST